MQTAKILVSIAVVGFAVVPAIADLNRTHATNPVWVGHARYHVVWQSVSYLLLGTFALTLTWADSSDPRGVYTAAAIAACVYGGFFGAAASMGAYEGRLHDDNGHAPLRIGGRSLDLNVLLFSPLVLVLAVGAALALAA